MKMYNMGSKGNDGMVATESKDKVHYPRLTLRSDQIPEVKDWQTGKKYTLHIVIKQTRSGESYSDPDVIEGEFDILKASVMKGMVSKEDYDKMDDEEKDKADEEEVMGEDE